MFVSVWDLFLNNDGMEKIELALPVFNLLKNKWLHLVLNAVCFRCYHSLSSREEVYNCTKQLKEIGDRSVDVNTNGELYWTLRSKVRHITYCFFENDIQKKCKNCNAKNPYITKEPKSCDWYCKAKLPPHDFEDSAVITQDSGLLSPSEVKEVLSKFWENEAALFSILRDVLPRNDLDCTVSGDLNEYFVESLLVLPMEHELLQEDDGYMSILLDNVSTLNLALAGAQGQEHALILQRWMELQSSVNDVIYYLSSRQLPRELLVEAGLHFRTKEIVGLQTELGHNELKEIVTSPEFLNLHLLRLMDRESLESLFLVSTSGSLTIIESLAENNVVANIVDGAIPTNFRKIISSINGLVLLLNENSDLVMINPARGLHKLIPPSPLATLVKDKVYGFGYEKSTKDYKIVVHSCLNRFATIEAAVPVHVYSANQNAWTRIVGFEPYMPFDCNGVFLRGVLHWLGAKTVDGVKRYALLCLNLQTLTVSEVQVAKRGQWCMDITTLSVLGDKICMCENEVFGSLSIRFMDSYGVDEWVQLTIDLPDNKAIDTFPVLMLNDEKEIVFLMVSIGLMRYDAETGRLESIIVNGDDTLFLDAAAYIDSIEWPFAV